MDCLKSRPILHLLDITGEDGTIFYRCAGGSAKNKTREGGDGDENPRQKKKSRVDAAPEPMEDDDTPIPFAHLHTDIQRAKRAEILRRIKDSAKGKAGLIDLAVKEGAYPDRQTAEKNVWWEDPVRWTRLPRKLLRQTFVDGAT